MNSAHPARPPSDPRTCLEQLFQSAIAAAMPGPAVGQALGREPTDPEPYLLALGKAALPMARSAITLLAAHGRRPAGGLVVCPLAEPVQGLDVIAGDHPLPGPGSAIAASALDSLTGRIPEGARVWVLLSGGATSLIAGPDRGLTLEDVRATFDALLRSGLEIGAMNSVRKRLTRWGGGKLAVALAQAEVLQLIVSDVIGDDLTSIGSGPLVADPATTDPILTTLRHARVVLPEAVRQRLEAMAGGSWPETPKPGDKVFHRVRSRIIVSNRMALEAVAHLARRWGWRATVEETPLQGEAAESGRHLVARLAGLAPAPEAQLLIAGGETTVTLGPAAGSGGRAQELVLAAAQAISAAHRHDLLVLAGGTDGRDGPTDAAGAVADGTTWKEISRAGLDPVDCLARHDSYPALNRAGALIRTGQSGTNVMDVALGLRLPEVSQG